MARKSSNPIPVDWKTLHDRITAYQKSAYEEDNLKKLFFAILDDESGCDPAPIFNRAFPHVEQAILDGRTQDALEQFAILSIDLCARVAVMAAAMRPLKRMVGHSARVKEAGPKARQKRSERAKERRDAIKAEFATRQRARGNHRRPTDTDIVNEMHDQKWGAINTIRKAAGLQ